MHINSDRLTEALTQVELLHIESCTQCKIERQKLMALRFSANQLDVVQPSDIIWTELRARLPKQDRQPSKFKQFIFASAASMFFASMGWLMWSHYNLQQQLEEVLLVNMLLEDKLNGEQQVTFQKATLVEELHRLDMELYQATSTKEKLVILQKRREMIKQHLALPKRDEHEFSI